MREIRGVVASNEFNKAAIKKSHFIMRPSVMVDDYVRGVLSFSSSVKNLINFMGCR